MLGIIISRADPASVNIGTQLREIEEWEQIVDGSRSGDDGGEVWETDGAQLREFSEPHLHLDRPASAFDEPDLILFASKHAGETGKLLTAHHTGNFGPADHGGTANELARSCPNAHSVVLDALAAHAPDDYDVGMECTHHGPSRVGAPSMFVEVGSADEQWEDTEAARAVAKAIMDLREVSPDRSVRSDNSATREGDLYRRHLVGLGGGHYAPRFERVGRETEWAFGHIAADWGLNAIDLDSQDGSDVLEEAFEQSRAAYALVDGDRPAIERAVTELGYQAVSESWVRETDGVDLSFVHAVESDVRSVADGLRFGDPARGEQSESIETWSVESLPNELIQEAYAIERTQTREAIETRALAFGTDEGGTRPSDLVVVASPNDRDSMIDRLVEILHQKYDAVEQTEKRVIVREEVFDPERARTLGVPEGPAFGKLADGQPVEVNGEEIPPTVVRSERENQFVLPE